MKIRLMKVDDFDAVVGIDEKVLKASRPEYYKLRFEKLFHSKDYLPASLVAEEEDGTVVGFVMGEIYMGQYGISQEKATLDTIGVDPHCQHKGVGKRLINEFMDHLRTLGVQKIRFFSDLVVASLIDFQCKVAQVMKAVGLTLDELDLVVHPFQFAGVDGVLTVIEDAVAVTLQHLGKRVQGAVIHRTGQRAPFIQGLAGPGSGSVRPDMLELVL